MRKLLLNKWIDRMFAALFALAVAASVHLIILESYTISRYNRGVIVETCSQTKFVEELDSEHYVIELQDDGYFRWGPFTKEAGTALCTKIKEDNK